VGFFVISQNIDQKAAEKEKNHQVAFLKHISPLSFNFQGRRSIFGESGQGEDEDFGCHLFGRVFDQGLFPTPSTTCSPITRLFMEFATETQTGPSRWTTDDVDVIAPTTPELQHSPSKWPLPVTLFAVAIVLLIIGMNWWEARRKRKLKEWRIARSV